MEPREVVGAILTIFLIAILLNALYPIIDKSFTDLKGTFQSSNNTYVKSYLPDLADYTPFLFVLGIIVTIIFSAVAYFKIKG